MKTVVVMPAHNEGKYIAQVLGAVKQHVDQVIVVDDGSTDNTYQQAAASGGNVVVLKQRINLGKGAALKTGCEAAVRLGADYIVSMDADNQHQPDMIPQFIQTLADKQVDIVFGSRPFNERMPFVMLLGNRFLSATINTLFHIFVRDTQSGFRAFTRAAYEKLRWDSTGYEVETEMIVRASEQHLTYAEIDIATIYHDHYKGTTAFDGLKILFHILRWKFI